MEALKRIMVLLFWVVVALAIVLASAYALHELGVPAVIVSGIVFIAIGMAIWLIGGSIAALISMALPPYQNPEAEERAEVKRRERLKAHAEPWIEKRGHVISPLRPVGHVQIEGEQKDAASKDDDLVPGQVVEVVGSRREYLLVRAVGDGEMG